MRGLYWNSLSILGLHYFVLEAISFTYVERIFQFKSDPNLLTPDSPSLLCVHSKDRLLLCCSECMRMTNCTSVIKTSSNCYCLTGISPDTSKFGENIKLYMMKPTTVCTHPEYSLYNDLCIKRSSTDRTWNAAELDCQSDGGHLAVLDSQAKIVELVDILYKYYPLPPDMDAYFVGASDLQQEGIWRWVKDSAVNYFPWKVTQPNNEDLDFPGQDADCASLRVTTSAMRDDYCDNPRPYVCELD